MKSFDDLTVYGIVHEVPIMQAEGLELLEKLLVENKAKSFLEIGTAIGKTSLMAASLDPEMRVVTIERDPKMAKEARENFEKYDTAHQITLIEADALEAELPDVNMRFDCIFIDALKAKSRNFFERYSPYLAADGIIVTDNMKFHGLVDHPERTTNRHTRAMVRKIALYRQWLENHPDYTTEFFDDTGDGIALTRRKQDA